ncbi:hypothetical protein HXX76_003914 [Chlamydomonas incerta]|uniref:Very-long-chain 3-oxoacyl-CoA synthase n=1 Tax=Chlamydomonas incerta TaxID=51695 RepID=A0A835TBM3_CHLIN|nr:hypothetical protein HXX76_003914 [Chlamydomonas incerta]|eukprot:KAG2441061.1 hypothetical protein HXX76_003914 [Chlamydomonas incerta]
MASLLPGAGSAGRVMLYDLNVYKPPPEYKVDQAAVIQLWRDTQRYCPADIDFQERVFARSGLAPVGTHLPPSINPAYAGNDAVTDLTSAAAECRMAVCGAVEGLLQKTGLQPRDIDILVTTCSIYCPTPSMASMVVNAFGLRKDVQAYHLGGMGCANGVVGVNLVADLLKAHPNSTALFVCTETTTPAYYRGNDRHRLVTNLLFRMGGAAVCLTNKPALRRRAKYELLHRVRVHTGQSDEALSAIYHGPDEFGHNGIYLGKNVVSQASRALGLAMTQVAPRILTWSQLAAAALHMLQQRRRRSAAGGAPSRQDGSSSTSTSSKGGAVSPPAAATDAEVKGAAPAPFAPAADAAPISTRRAAPSEGNGSSCGSAGSSSGGGSSDDDDRSRISGDGTPQPGLDDKQQSPPSAGGACEAGGAAAGAAKSGADGAEDAEPPTPAPTPAPSCDPSAHSKPAAQHHPHPKGPQRGSGSQSQQYRPNFQQSTCRHFLLHAGGAKVLDGLGEALQLDAGRLAPSRAVLHDYGNVSSSTTWYTLAHVETVSGVRRGERVLQVGVGSGIKCGVNVWKALRDVRDVHPAWEHWLPPAEATALRLAASVDLRGLGSRHVAGRALFAAVMVLAAVVMHALMLRLAAAGLVV